MLLRFTEHAECAGVITAFTLHLFKQRIKQIIIALLLGH